MPSFRDEFLPSPAVMAVRLAQAKEGGGEQENKTEKGKERSDAIIA